tara:strand:- start:266 stop:463 length:198 start_codon:yes stop_codon:yes gene_type:complete
MSLEYPKEILKHRNTGEVFHIVGAIEEEGYIKYKLQSQELLNERPRRVKKLKVYLYFRVVGYYEI